MPKKTFETEVQELLNKYSYTEISLIQFCLNSTKEWSKSFSKEQVWPHARANFYRHIAELASAAIVDDYKSYR